MQPEEVEALVATWGEPSFRAKQIFQAVQRDGVLDPDQITTLPLALRERMKERAAPAMKLVEVQTSKDRTRKYLFELADGKRIESVLIPEADRATVCISAQVGCPIACIFCASGVRGLIRNLTIAEIVEQLLHVAADLGSRPTNVVMMGMGEPLLNLKNVIAAIRLWTHDNGMNFSPRRITVSTAGTPAKIDQLAEAGLGVQLALSLHAPNDEVRAELVPGSPAGRVQALVDAAARFAYTTRRDATVEYVLIRDLNDRPEHARDLAHAIRGRHIHVNLIPLNPVGHRPDLLPPSGTAAEGFARYLKERGVSVTLRTQRGEDIDAACGQLALERSLTE